MDSVKPSGSSVRYSDTLMAYLFINYGQCQPHRVNSWRKPLAGLGIVSHWTPRLRLRETMEGPIRLFSSPFLLSVADMPCGLQRYISEMIFAQNIQYSWMLVAIWRLYLSLLNGENLKKNHHFSNFKVGQVWNLIWFKKNHNSNFTVGQVWNFMAR